MAKEGFFIRLVSAERSIAARAMNFDGLHHGKHSKKAERIHILIHDEIATKNVVQTHKRCECGGWTFSKTNGIDAYVCRHCGKKYFKNDFDNLTEKALTGSEIHDRRIYSVLLAGGDLREHAEESKLVFKDENGIPLGHLPMEYADHLAKTYNNVRVMRTIRANKVVIQNCMDVTPVATI